MDVSEKLMRICGPEMLRSPQSERDAVAAALHAITAKVADDFNHSDLLAERGKLTELIGRIRGELGDLARRRAEAEANALAALKAGDETGKLDRAIDALDVQAGRLRGRLAALEADLARMRDPKDARAESYSLAIEKAHREQLLKLRGLEAETLAAVEAAIAPYRSGWLLLEHLAQSRTFYTPTAPPAVAPVIDIWAQQKPQGEFRPPEAGLGMCTLITGGIPCTGDLYVSHEGGGAVAQVRCYRCGQDNVNHPLSVEFAQHASAEAKKMAAV